MGFGQIPSEKTMSTRFCRDCANYEERRDIDGVPLCSENIGPYVSCDEFEPHSEALNSSKLYNKFCIECASFDEVAGVPLCSRNRSPGVACHLFQSRFEELKVTRQNNHMKAVLLIRTSNNHALPEIIPPSLAEISRRLKW